MMDLRKPVSVGVVLLLHGAVIAALVFAMQRPPATGPTRFVEIVVRLRPHFQPSRIDVPGAPSTIFAPEIPAPHIDVAPEAPRASVLTGVGHALFGCDIDRLGTLPPEEPADCLHRPSGRPREPSLQLGPYDENSPFAQVIARRDAPFVPMEHACAPNEGPNANLGLPCFSFPNEAIGTSQGIR